MDDHTKSVLILWDPLHDNIITKHNLMIYGKQNILSAAMHVFQRF